MATRNRKLKTIITDQAHRFWRLLARRAESVEIYTPYITGDILIKIVEQPSIQKVKIYTTFDDQDYLRNSSSLWTLEALLKIMGHKKIEVFKYRGLHAKILKFDNKVISIGSQNLTKNGQSRTRSELTTISNSRKVYQRAQSILDKWHGSIDTDSCSMNNEQRIVAFDAQAIKDFIQTTRKLQNDNSEPFSHVDIPIEQRVHCTFQLPSPYYRNVMTFSRSTAVNQAKDALNTLEHKKCYLTLIKSTDASNSRLVWSRVNKTRISLLYSRLTCRDEVDCYGKKFWLTVSTNDHNSTGELTLLLDFDTEKYLIAKISLDFTNNLLGINPMSLYVSDKSLLSFKEQIIAPNSRFTRKLQTWIFTPSLQRAGDVLIDKDISTYLDVDNTDTFLSVQPWNKVGHFIYLQQGG